MFKEHYAINVALKVHLQVGGRKLFRLRFVSSVVMQCAYFKRIRQIITFVAEVNLLCTVKVFLVSLRLVAKPRTLDHGIRFIAHEFTLFPSAA